MLVSGIMGRYADHKIHDSELIQSYFKNHSHPVVRNVGIMDTVYLKLRLRYSFQEGD